MVWNRLYLKNRIKSSMMQARGVEDGLLTDDLIDEAINEAITILAEDCHLNWMEQKIALVASQYEYELPADLSSIRAVWYVNSDGRRTPLDYLSPEKIMDGVDPTDTGSEPSFFSYPHFQGKLAQFYGASDYLKSSTVTTASGTILIDSAANFGKLLDGGVIKPGYVISNITDDSYGYVYALDLTTNLTTGTATGDTSNVRLYDTGKNFVTLGADEYYVICKPSTGNVTAYAIVSAVATTYLTYRDYQDPEGASFGFVQGDTYKVGIANRIRLSPDPPHPNLRDGADNTFAVDDSYKIQSNFRTEPVMWINPAPDTTDTTGSESLRLLYNRMPELPGQDSDPIVIPQRYSVPLLACARWQAYLLKGTAPEAALDALEARYSNSVRPFLGDSWRPPRGAIISPWRNRQPSYARAHRYTTSSGRAFDASGFE